MVHAIDDEWAAELLPGQPPEEEPARGWMQLVEQSMLLTLDLTRAYEAGDACDRARIAMALAEARACLPRHLPGAQPARMRIIRPLEE